MTHSTSTLPNTNTLSATGCTAPRADGGWGFCGPPSCKDAYITCNGVPTIDGVTGTYATQGSTTYSASNCQTFLERTAGDDATDWSPKGACDSSCTQQTTGVCSSKFLEGVLKGDGIKYAYCNDKYLVIEASGEVTGFAPNLDDVPFPPGGGKRKGRG